MKRFLLLFCATVLSCALIVVPAFAYEVGSEPYLWSEYANENMVVFDDPIEDGYYTLTVAFTDDLIPFIQTPVFEITESVDFTFYNVLNSDEQLRLWGGLQDDGTYSFFLASVYSDGDFEYMVPSEPCYDLYVALYSESGAGAPVKGNQPALTDSGSIMDVFGVVGTWIIGMLTSMTGIFWTGSQLTMVGVLAVCGLAFAVVFLIVALISRFLHFRG